MINHDEIVQYAQAATEEVFSTMLSIAVKPRPEYLEDMAPTISDGVMAIVGLAGPWIGAGVITCSRAFAIRVCNQLLMAEETAINEDVLDAIGEVTNMIIGNFKTMVENHLGPLCLSIPTVIHGRNFTARSIGNNSWVVLPFECDGDVIEIRICLSASKSSAAPRVGAAHIASTVG